MKILDLRNNRLSGEIPAKIESLTAMEHMFLTNNSLNGTFSNWILNNKQNLNLEVAAHPENDIASMTFNFWHNLQANLTKRSSYVSYGDEAAIEAERNRSFNQTSGQMY